MVTKASKDVRPVARVSQAVETYVKNCSHCQKRYVSPKEPLISSTLPSRPWDRVAADLFELNNNHYNYCHCRLFSRYPEVCQLKSTTSVSVVKTLKAIFASHQYYFRTMVPSSTQQLSKSSLPSIISSMLLAARDTPKAMG